MNIRYHSKLNSSKTDIEANWVDNLVSYIVHQLKNPVQSIRQYLFLIRAEYPELIEKNTAFNNDLSMIEEDINRISNILKGLRDSYQIELGGGEVLSCTKIFEDTFMNMNIPEGVDIISRFEEDLPNIIGSNRLTKIFAEIISNAIEAMDGKGIVDISVSQNIVSGMVEIIIKDSGTGVAETHQDHIFDPLVTTKEKGRGFGLFWCKNYLESIQGDIEMISDESSQGAVFQVKLKIADEH